MPSVAKSQAEKLKKQILNTPGVPPITPRPPAHTQQLLAVMNGGGLSFDQKGLSALRNPLHMGARLAKIPLRELIQRTSYAALVVRLPQLCLRELASRTIRGRHPAISGPSRSSSALLGAFPCWNGCLAFSASDDQRFGGHLRPCCFEGAALAIRRRSDSGGLRLLDRCGRSV